MCKRGLEEEYIVVVGVDVINYINSFRYINFGVAGSIFIQFNKLRQITVQHTDKSLQQLVIVYIARAPQLFQGFKH